MRKTFSLIIFSVFLTSIQYAAIDEIFNLDDQKIVIATKKLEFPLFPEAFNPSIIKIDREFLLTFRYCPDHKHQPWLSDIVIVVLDESLSPISEPYVLKNRPKRSKTPSQAEDARLFSFKEKLFLIYNDNVDEIFFDNSKRRDMFIAELLYKDGQFLLLPPLKLCYEAKYDTQLQQKNWGPFEWNEQLYFSYSLDPHEVIIADLNNGCCYFSHKTEAKIDWKYGSLRGSTPPILVDGEYLSFFHSSKKIKSPVSHDWKLWHYFTGAYTFSAEPPFSINKISLQPIIAGDFYTPSFLEKRVIFPGGFVVSGNRLYMAYGKDDCEIWIATLDLGELKKSLIPIVY